MLRITSQNRVLLGALFFVYFILVIQPWELFFLNDDFIHIPLSTKTIWVHFQFFRPVPNLVTSLEIRLFGTDPLGYHITSILLHIITTILVIKLFRALSTTYGHAEKYRNTDFIAGCLFFLYPFHSEPVMWVIGRIAILATLFVVISLLLFVRRSRGRLFYFLSLCSFAIALLTYEISWIVPVTVTIFAVFDHYRKEKQFHKSIVALAPYWILFGILLVVRFSMLQGVMTRYEVTGRDISPIALAGKWLRLFARTVVPPSESTKTFIIIFACAVIVLVTFAVYLVRSQKMNRLHWLLICSLGISYLPTVSIGIDTHGSEGERYLYLPSVFWIFLLSTFLSELPEKAARNVFGCLLFTYCFLLSSAASNYGEASKAARNLLSATSGYSGDGKIIAVNIPSNYKGALIFRSGFSEANHWFYPGITDSIIAFPAGRTYERIRSVDTVSLEDLRNHGVVFF